MIFFVMIAQFTTESAPPEMVLDFENGAKMEENRALMGNNGGKKIF